MTAIVLALLGGTGDVKTKAAELEPKVAVFLPAPPEGWTATELDVEAFEDPVEKALQKEIGLEGTLAWHAATSRAYTNGDRTVRVRFQSLDIAGAALVQTYYDTDDGKKQVASDPRLDFFEYAGYRGLAQKTDGRTVGVVLQVESTATLTIQSEDGDPVDLEPFLKGTNFKKMKAFLKRLDQ